MNGEATAVKAEKIIFALNSEEKEITEIKTVEVQQIRIAEVKAAFDKNRFGRLKKSLRKRSAGIL